MSEITMTFCDVCNIKQRLTGGRGYLEACDEKTSVAAFGWYLSSDEMIVCVDCQDEARLAKLPPLNRKARKIK